LSSTRQANHHRRKPAGERTGQRPNRVFERYKFLQFDLGYTPLQAGVRVLPAAAAVAVISPLSAFMVRLAGAKLTVAAGLAFIAGGLWQISYEAACQAFAGSAPGTRLV
jgi:hypothetical protein